jgi:hypothetical protein
MRINGSGSDFAIGAQDGVKSPRSGPAPNAESAPGGTDEVVLSSTGTAAALALKAVVNSGNYQPDSLQTAGRIVDSAIARID